MAIINSVIYSRFLVRNYYCFDSFNSLSSLFFPRPTLFAHSISPKCTIWLLPVFVSFYSFYCFFSKYSTRCTSIVVLVSMIYLFAYVMEARETTHTHTNVCWLWWVSLLSFDCWKGMSATRSHQCVRTFENRFKLGAIIQAVQPWLSFVFIANSKWEYRQIDWINN